MALNPRDTLGELQRMSQLLALVAIRGVEEIEAITILSRAGFTHAEIGALLGLTGTAVKLRLLRKRRRDGKKRNPQRSISHGQHAKGA